MKAPLQPAPTDPVVRHRSFVSLVTACSHLDDEMLEAIRQWDSILASLFEHHELVVVIDPPHRALEERGHAGEVPALTGSLTLLELSRPHGLELAMMAGLQRTIGDFVLEVDAAAELPAPETVSHLYVETSTGWDIVGARPAETPRGTRAFYSVLNRYGHLSVEMGTERLRMVSRRAVNAMLALTEKVRYRKALYALTGYPYRIVTLPREGRSPAPTDPARPRALLAMDLLFSFSDVGLRSIFYLTSTFAIFSTLSLAYVLVATFLLDTVVEGWTTIMVLLSFGLTGVFLTFAVIGEYLARILMEVRDRPLYRVHRDQTISPRR